MAQEGDHQKLEHRVLMIGMSIICNYSGTLIFEYNTDFIGLILKLKKK